MRIEGLIAQMLTRIAILGVCLMGGSISSRSAKAAEHQLSDHRLKADAERPESVRALPTTTTWFRAVAAFVEKKWPNLPHEQLEFNDSARVCRERIAWLGRDFRTKAFAKALPNCGEGQLKAEENGLWPQIGIIVVEFPTCRSLAAAREAVKNSKRSAFRLPIATTFRAIARGRALLFVTSESVLRDDVGELLDGLETFAADQRACTEGQLPSSH